MLRPPVHNQRYGLPDFGVCTSQFEGRNTRLGPLRSSRTHAAASTAFEAALGHHARGQRIGAARRTIFCRNVRQTTARIDRTIDNVVVCRDFVRSVYFTTTTRGDGLIDRSRGYRPRTNA
jgi:hypothetical protein